MLKTRKPDVIPSFKLDIAPVEGGAYVPRFWRVVNTSVLGKDGFVRLIINQINDLIVVSE